MRPMIFIPPSAINPVRKDVSYNLLEDMEYLVNYYSLDRIYKTNMKDYVLSLQMEIDHLFNLYKQYKPHILFEQKPQYFIRVTDYSVPHFIVILKWDEPGSWGWNEREIRFYSNPDAIKVDENFVWID